MFNKTLIIGLGFIGGSFARACKKYNITNQIFAFDLNEDSLKLAIDSKIVDGFISLEDKMSDFDLIVIATPLSTYKEIFTKIAGKVSKEVTIIDLGSLKEIAIKSLPISLKDNFIACHPIAGSENSGFESSVDDLFLDKKFIICSEKSNPIILKKVENLVKKIGANLEFLEASKHDEIYALVSHLPQFLSFLTKDFSPKNIKDKFFKTAFRLDNSNSDVWLDIFKFNEKNLEKFYLEFFDNLINFEEKIIDKNFDDIIKDLKNEANFVQNKAEFSEDFFEKNFSEIFFRVIFVASFLKISAIKTFQSFAGKGFEDFISIISILKSSKNLDSLLEKNQQKILKLFNKLEN